MWDEVVEKAVNTEVKANLQPSSGTREIDSRCLKEYRPLVKKNKDDVYQEYCNEVFNKQIHRSRLHPQSATDFLPRFLS